MEFTKDLANKKVIVKREFKAPVEEVWKAWTTSELLDQWWAPKPWKARTKSMDFNEGGTWFYTMVGPDGEQHHARADYKSIVPNKSYTAADSFCDEEGNIDTEAPSMMWYCTFEKSNNGTLVKVEISFQDEEDIDTIIEMGFKEGFTAALENLDEMFSSEVA